MKEMKEEVQKIIKASFCPKEKWIRDDDAENCFKCDKKFHPLFRRKHHCRYCGQVFCATCSEFYISGKDLGETDKPIRMCEACYQKCWKYIAKHDDNFIEHRKSGDHDSAKELPSNIEQIQLLIKGNTFSEEDKLKQIQSIIEEYSATENNGITKLEQEIQVRFALLLQVILKQAHIPLRYLPQINAMAHEIVNKVPPNFVVTGNMAVCPNVRIKGFFGEQFRMSLESVVLVKKAFTSKRIRDEYSNVTCILVFGSIESADLVGGEKQASFENMINNRLKEMNKIISYCQRVKINMIFLEGNIEKEFQDLLLNSNITVIPKVKVEYLSRLKTSLRIEKIVEGIVLVYGYPEKEITGNIAKITSTNYLSCKEGQATKKFFKISTARAQLGLTLILMDNNAKMLENLKRELRFILQMLTHMRLKIYKVKMDQNLLQSMTEIMRKNCYLNNAEMFFSFYNEFHHDLLSYVKEKYVSFKHLTYVESDFNNYPEVTKPAFEDYLKGRSHSFKNKWGNFTEICGDIRDEHKMFYSEQDMPLGSFLLKKLTALDKKCTTCCRPNYLHSDVYYSTDQYVKIWAESMIVDQAESESNPYSSFTSQDENVRNVQMEMIFTYLEKHSGKEKLKCYIECYDCQQPISTPQNVYKPDLEFSILSFLHHMFKGSTETNIRQNNSRKAKAKNVLCSHTRKARVFGLGSKSVKIFVGKYTINRQCLLTDTGREYFLKGKQNKAITEVCMLESTKIDRIMGFLYDEIKSIAELAKNSKFDSIIKNPRHSFINARNSVRSSIGSGNLRLSQSQCIDMIIPELIEQVSKVNTTAQLMLSNKRIPNYLEGLKVAFQFMVLLKRCYLIISEVKKAVKKRELDQKYNLQNFDRDYLTEEMDMNQFMDSTSSVDTESEFTGSQISKSELFSNTHTIDTGSEVADYGWLQPFDKDTLPSRLERKTESNMRTNKSSKMSEEEVYRTFKTISSALKMDEGYFDFIPCYPTKPHSLIATALNSRPHKLCLQSSTQFANQLNIKSGGYLDCELPPFENEEMRKLHSLIQTQQRMFDIGSKMKKQTNIAIDITVLYPNEFEVLRRKHKIPLELFISSIAGADNWLATGGKSGSPFMRSFNDLLVIKKVPKTEFFTFKKFLPEYFTHLHEGSTLTPIYGAYIINRNLSAQYFVVMQNLFFGMREWHLYDFKGSVTKRFSKPPVIPLDVNFLIDRNSEPMFCKANVLQHLTATLEYLAQNKIIDYSLILVVEIERADDFYLDGNRFQIGVVDYMREFGAGEWVEHMLKGPEATVVEPEVYKTRMLKNLRKYFTQIPL